MTLVEIQVPVIVSTLEFGMKQVEIVPDKMSCS